MYSKLHNPLIAFAQQNNHIRIGLCLPASCPAEDIEYSLTEHLNRSKKSFEHHGATYTISATDDLCSSNSKPNEFGKWEIVFCTISAVLLLLVILATVTNENKTKIAKDWDKFYLGRKFCMAFSATRNWKSLFRPYEDHEETKIFNGMRSIILILTIFVHKCEYITWRSPWMNHEYLLQMSNSKLYLLIEKLDLTVNTFFLMSGLLLSYGVFKKNNNVKINPVLIIFLRYVRLTPLNAYVSLFIMTILKFCGSGPVRSLLFDFQITNCQKNIWTNIFYINSFLVGIDEWCNPVTWYISADFQLFIVGILTLCIIKCNKRLGYSILGILFILSIITPFTLTMVYKLTPIFGTYYDENILNYSNVLYLKSYNHASTYIVGIFGGILYHHLTCNNVKISKVPSYFIIAISSFFMILSFGYLAIFYHQYENYNAIKIALYNSLHRLIWSIGVLGIFVVTSFGPMTLLRKFLSSSFWIPISKLTYAAILIHIPLVSFDDGNTSTVINGSMSYILSRMTADLIIIFLISLVLYIVVEIPIMKLFKFIFLSKFYHMEEAKEAMTLEVNKNVQTENNVSEASDKN